ncbi:UNVERIFIED_CONTAM: hypothetical protein FKN15_054832 [Acipenser sinensis]
MESMLNRWLWRHEYWLPPGVTWSDMVETESVQYPQPRDLLLTLPLSLVFIAARYAFESHSYDYWLAEHDLTKSPEGKRQNQFHSLSKQCDLSQRQIERWFRLRRNQDRPSNSKKFCEACWRFTFYMIAFLAGLAVLVDDEETVDVTPIMICVFVVMCCSMLVLLYYFYDHLVYMIIGIFCLAASIGLYSCLSPFVRRIPFGKCRIPENNLPYCHKRPQVRMLLLSVFCVSVSVIWGVFRNEDQWAWVLQDALGIAFCLYMLKTIRLPTFKACTLLLAVLFVYDVFFVFITPLLTKSGESIMVEVAAGPSDSSTHEKLPMVLKVPRLNFSPLALCDRPFSLLGFGDILVPGLLVAYCHRFDIQVQSSQIYFVACTVAYGIGLLITFVALALMQMGQPALLYLVPCTLLTSLGVALWRRELAMFWTGSGFAKEMPQPPLVMTPINCTQSPDPPTKEQLPSPALQAAEEATNQSEEVSPREAKNQSD